MSAAIGIDLGTTRSVVAVMGAYGPQVLAVDAPPVGERPGDPHGHAVTVLARLKRESEVLRGEDPDDAVLAVPAFYGPDQRVALRKAAERAGFRVLRQVDAPVATAVAHGWARGGAPEVVAVLDVGPAYVSAAVVELGEARTGVWAVSGRIVAGGGDAGVVAVNVLVSVLRSVGWRVGDVDEVLLTGNGWGAVLPETIAGLGGRSVDARSTPAAGGAVLLAAMMRGDIGGWLPEDASPRLPLRQGVVHPREDGLRKAALRLAADIRWARGDDLGQLPAEVRNRLDALEDACATWNPAFEGGDPGPVAAAHERLAVAYERLQAAEAAPAPQRDAAASAASPAAPYASAPVAPYASAPVAPYASAPAAPSAVAPVRSIVVDAVRAQEAVALPQSRPAGPAKAVREVKVVLLGDGAAGKTSLAAALCGEAFAHRDATHGVEVRELAVGDGLVLRLWDFGGQAIYRSTHQFFHSADAVYLVVWSAREAHRQDVVRDWLRRLRGRLGDSARVLVVATHCDQFEAEVDDRLAEEYPGLLAGQFAVDNASGNGIGEVRAVLAREAAGLAGEPWPESWRAVRDALAGLRREEPQIPFERLAALGREHGVADAEGLAVALHRAGHVLFHHDDDVLRDVVVLDPEWLSRTIADVVGDPGVRRQHGVLEHARLAEIWRPALAGRRLPAPYLLRLMERFDLSYRLDEHRSLIPQLLPGAGAGAAVDGGGLARPRRAGAALPVPVPGAGGRADGGVDGTAARLQPRPALASGRVSAVPEPGRTFERAAAVAGRAGADARGARGVTGAVVPQRYRGGGGIPDVTVAERALPARHRSGPRRGRPHGAALRPARAGAGARTRVHHQGDPRLPAPVHDHPGRGRGPGPGGTAPRHVPAHAVV